jgi:hypothetical protein
MRTTKERTPSDPPEQAAEDGFEVVDYEDLGGVIKP